MPHQSHLLRQRIFLAVSAVLWLTVTGFCADPPPGGDFPTNNHSVQTTRERIAALRAAIAYHDELYFQKAAPEISDASYDALKRELRSLEQAYPEEAAAIASGPSLVDDHQEGFTRQAHLSPMLSLDKLHSAAELQAFYTRVSTSIPPPATFLLEPKIDGVAVSVIYEQGKLIRAVTRGDGLSGDDISANAMAMPSLPRELRVTNPDGTRNPLPERIELRGEIYLSQEAFARINRDRAAQGEPPFAHPRNLAAGTIKSHDPQDTARRGLAVVFHGWGAWVPADRQPPTQLAFHQQAQAWGLPVIETYEQAEDFAALQDKLKILGERRRLLKAPTDGVVIKLNQTFLRPILGESSHAPRWAAAYKFSTERVSARVLHITMQVGRTGLLSPVAVLEPVVLGGSVITRASLHNGEVIRRLDVRPGDYVFLEKAGEIIPRIVEVDVSRRTEPGQPYEIPTSCPKCGTTINVEEGGALRCPNTAACPGQLQQRITHFAGDAGVNISGLGDATIALLLENGLIQRIPDLYQLSVEDLRQLPGFGDRSAQKLVQAIDRSRGAPLWKFIQGLGIPNIGPSAARILAEAYGSLPQLAMAATGELPLGLGNQAGQSLRAYLRQAENQKVLSLLATAVSPSHPDQATPE